MFSSVDDALNEKIVFLLQKAKAFGATSADVVLAKSYSFAVKRRLGKEESVTRSEESTVGLRVFVGQKSAIVSSSDIAHEALMAMAERAVAMAREVPKDIFGGIASPDEILKFFPDLDLYDPTEPELGRINDWLDVTEQAALNYKGVTNSDGVDFETSKSRFYYAATNGFMSSYASSDFGISVAVIAGKNTNMQMGFDFDSSVFLSDLERFETLGVNAAEMAVKSLNPKKISTGRMPVIIDRKISGGVIGSLAASISGSAVSKGTTVLKDKMGEQIFSSNITIVDDPFIKRGTRSCPFDAEGISPQKRNIIENGVLTGWLLDLRSARQLGLKTTGNASRGASSNPYPSASNFYMQPGTMTVDELMSDITRGFYITEMMGSGVNIVNGDYSRGAKGFLIENGKITSPVAEVTVAGNLIDMWQELVPASDLKLKRGVDAPTLRMNNITVAGE